MLVYFSLRPRPERVERAAKVRGGCQHDPEGCWLFSVATERKDGSWFVDRDEAGSVIRFGACWGTITNLTDRFMAQSMSNP